VNGVVARDPLEHLTLDGTNTLLDGEQPPNPENSIPDTGRTLGVVLIQVGTRSARRNVGYSSAPLFGHGEAHYYARW
jgi:hypothetical protein